MVPQLKFTCFQLNSQFNSLMLKLCLNMYTSGEPCGCAGIGLVHCTRDSSQISASAPQILPSRFEPSWARQVQTAAYPPFFASSYKQSIPGIYSSFQDIYAYIYYTIQILFEKVQQTCRRLCLVTGPKKNAAVKIFCNIPFMYVTVHILQYTYLYNYLNVLQL